MIAAAETIGRTPRVRVQVRSFDTMCRMVAWSLGLAILPQAAATLFAQALGLRVVALQGLEVKRRLLLAMRRRAELSAAAAALVEMIERESSDLVGRTEQRGG